MGHARGSDLAASGLRSTRAKNHTITTTVQNPFFFNGSMIESSLLLFNTNAVALFLALFICFHEIQRLLCMGKIEKNPKNRTLHKRNALSSFFLRTTLNAIK